MSIIITKLGWLELPLEEICSQIVGGGTPSTKVMQYWQGDIPWITSADILDTKTVLPKKYITLEAIKNSATNIVPKHTIIVVTRVGLGKIGIAPVDLCFSQDNQGLIFYANIVDTNYALFYLSKAVIGFKQSGRGTTINGVTKDQLRNLVFKLPPLPEQRAIVAKIETLFSELDNGIESLKKAQEQLKVYRQAVLKWAFEGKLTEEWRQENKDQPGTIEELLEKIRTERQKCYKEELDDFTAGKSKKKPRSSMGLAPITEKELAKLPKLPESWAVVKFANIVVNVGDVDHKMPQAQTDGIPYISTKDFFDNNEINFEEAKKISLDDYLQLSKKIKPSYHDLLISRYGTVGEIRKVTYKGIFQASYSIAIVNTLKDELLIEWLFYCLKSEFIQKQIREYTRSTTQADLGLDHIRILAIPLPSSLEQTQIINEIKNRLSVADYLEKNLTDGLQKAEAFRQSILKKAFEGKLLTEAELLEVRKAPDWEPAERLLERIKAEKSKVQPQIKSSEKRGKR